MEAFFDEHFPGQRLVFAGDMPEGSYPDIERAVEEMEKRIKNSIETGACFMCGDQMREYLPGDTGWEPENGWQKVESISGGSQCWRCPSCAGNCELEPDFE